MADKTNMIALRLNDEQMTAVHAWAKQHNGTVSEVIRLAIQMMTGASVMPSFGTVTATISQSFRTRLCVGWR